MTNLKKSLQNRSPGLKNRHGVEKDDQKNCPFGPPTMCFRTLPPCKQNRSCLPSHRLLSQSVATDIRSHSLYCNETKMTFNSLYNSVLALHRTQQAPNASQRGACSGLLCGLHGISMIHQWTRSLNKGKSQPLSMANHNMLSLG
ncbi:hypothetical protein MPSEU_001005400 [Mayamaea pseudoterrestris]|nr:hypothetical protein MPSEU_001005400 [Mayamaea pseudoterrestris]